MYPVKGHAQVGLPDTIFAPERPKQLVFHNSTQNAYTVLTRDNMDYTCCFHT